MSKDDVKLPRARALANAPSSAYTTAREGVCMRATSMVRTAFLATAALAAVGCSGGDGGADVREVISLDFIAGVDVFYGNEATVDDTGDTAGIDPGTTDPGTVDPGKNDPGQPVDPGTVDPGQTDPGGVDPTPTDPIAGEEVLDDPGTPDPGKPDPGPCLNTPSANGFRDNCDGTVTDNTTSKMWTKGMYQATDFNDGNKYCADNVLGDYTDWRLPTIDELRRLIIGCPATTAGGACTIHDGCKDDGCINAACTDGCANGQGPGASGCYTDDTFEYNCNLFISSSAYASKPVSGDYRRWYVEFYDARVYRDDQVAHSGGWLRCIRP